jgi:hypothetical protein
MLHRITARSTRAHPRSVPAGDLVECPFRLAEAENGERQNGAWVSIGSEMNTFMPLRRGIADDDRRMIPWPRTVPCASGSTASSRSTRTPWWGPRPAPHRGLG